MNVLTLPKQVKWNILNFLPERRITKYKAFLLLLLHLNVDPVGYNPICYLQNKTYYNTIWREMRRGGHLFAFTTDWVPQSVNGKLNMTVSLDLFGGLQLWFWLEGIQTASRLRGGTVAFRGMIMLNPSWLQNSCVAICGLSFVFTSAEKNTSRIKNKYILKHNVRIFIRPRRDTTLHFPFTDEKYRLDDFNSSPVCKCHDDNSQICHIFLLNKNY